MSKPLSIATTALAGMLLVPVQACDEPSEAPVVQVTGGAVSAGTPDAARVGREILARGGNAADAAVAASLALAVTEPGQSGLGGVAVALVRPPGEAPVVIHVPRASVGPAGQGGSAITAPALLPVLERLWREHGSGTLEWQALVEPAARLAEEGFPLGRLAHRIQVREYPRLVADSGLAALFLTGNAAIPAEGTVRARPELAATLQRIAREGPADLYQGELATRLVDWAAGAGVPLGPGELSAAARTETAPALEGAFRAWTVWTAPEPFAGPAVLRALAFLETAPEPVRRASAGLRAPWTVEALVWGLGAPGDDLAAWTASLAPLPVPLTDTAAAGTPAGPAGAPGRPGPGAAPRRADRWIDAGSRGETTHLSVVDEDGGAVSLTQTLGRPFGSGIPAADLGFVLGAAEGEGIASVPGYAADSAPSGGEAAAVEAGEAAASRHWLSPTLVARGDTLTLVLGSPGGPRGVSAVVQVIDAWTGAPLELQAAVSAPRIHVGPAPGTERGRVYLEGLLTNAADSTLTRAPAPWSDTVRSGVAARDFLVTERDTGLYFQGLTPWFGGVNAVARVGDEWQAAADPRRDGVGLRVSESPPERERALPGPGGEGRPPPPP